ncbi:MAG: 5-methyltetrahydrofolate corrinoid/iron sulfur protein methyltransferase, partial [Eubacteriaceae bacterium]|nr:5-methyltetrahydrofolate corrinoid/iron sulfur protein methyltransferase [Eubacteriaceae bacterium]
MIIIGEKINGAIPSTAKAIAAKDTEFIRNLAIKQAEAGADYIDVCASVDDDIEMETMKWLIDIVQDAVDTPIAV